jgi:5-(carboxyamino)imidazole ribonucleotide synthase
VRKFSAGVSVVTFEFENVPSATAEAAGAHAPVRPSGSILHTTQHRLREKTFLAGAGFPLTPFLPIRTSADLTQALEQLGRPAVLKTADFGYDGKGQALIGPGEDAEAAWQSIGRVEAVLEAFVDFERELSVVAARGGDGSFAHYGAIENTHRNRILDVSIAPACVPAAVTKEAVRIARGVLDELDVVGVLCVEFFHTRDGKLLINELAPRPHNSGHLTFDACVTSQFEQQLRAVCGLPLGSAELLRPAAMANLLGDLWQGGTPDWGAVCGFEAAKLHLYGKLAPRPGRKMGHITALAGTAKEAERIVRSARDAAVARPSL